jgi:hypothetical protein
MGPRSMACTTREVACTRSVEEIWLYSLSFATWVRRGWPPTLVTVSSTPPFTERPVTLKSLAPPDTQFIEMQRVSFSGAAAPVMLMRSPVAKAAVEANVHEGGQPAGVRITAARRDNGAPTLHLWGRDPAHSSIHFSVAPIRIRSGRRR